MRDVYQDEAIGKLIKNLQACDNLHAKAMAATLGNAASVDQLPAALQVVVNTMAACVRDVGSFAPECQAVVRARTVMEEQRACRALAKAVNDSLDAVLYGVPNQGAMWREIARRYDTLDAGMADQFLGLLGYPRDNLGVGLEWHVTKAMEREAGYGQGVSRSRGAAPTGRPCAGCPHTSCPSPRLRPVWGLHALTARGRASAFGSQTPPAAPLQPCNCLYMAAVGGMLLQLLPTRIGCRRDVRSLL